MRATLRRTGWSVLVFLDSTAEDVGLLRRAIATTAHEVRGPVAVLCGIAETLAWDADQMSLEQTRRLMDSVARQARILDRITADLLTAAQIQRGTLRIDHQVVEPRTLILGAIEGRWDVEVDIEDDRSVRADPLRLEQMLTNLLSNAAQVRRRAVRRPRPRRGRTTSPSTSIDHGEGVPPEFSDHLFSRVRPRPRRRRHRHRPRPLRRQTLAAAQNGSVSYVPGLDGGSVFTIRLLAC